jgi:hypothetical protein
MLGTMRARVKLQHVNVKLFVNDMARADLEPLIPIFHSWISGRVFEEMLLDIGDYRHVPAGPGIVLIGHQGDYSVDNAGDRLGVRYNRKTPIDGDSGEALRQAARAALIACQRLEEEPRLGGKLRFNGQEIEVFVNDRLVAPNSAATFAALRPDLDKFSEKLFHGDKYSLVYESGRDPRSLFGVALKSSRSFTVVDLLQNLALSA